MKLACATSTSTIAVARTKSRPNTRLADSSVMPAPRRKRAGSLRATQAPAAHDAENADYEPEELHDECRQVERERQRQQHAGGAQCIHPLIQHSVAAHAAGLKQEVGEQGQRDA